MLNLEIELHYTFWIAVCVACKAFGIFLVSVFTLLVHVSDASLGCKLKNSISCACLFLVRVAVARPVLSMYSKHLNE